MRSPRLSVLLASVCALATHAQTPDSPAVETLPTGLGRLAGTAPTGDQYVRIFLPGKLGTEILTAPPTNNTPPPIDLTQPLLIGQCMKTAEGKTRFDIVLNFGNVPDPAFYPPWRKSRDDLYPPPTKKSTFSIEFIGYTHWKPFKRQFEELPAVPGDFRYNAPGGGSSNLEEFPFFFQYLRSLPTFRITREDKTAVQYLTPAFLAQLHKEPLCQPLGL